MQQWRGAREREEDCLAIQVSTDGTQAQGQQIQFREQKCEKGYKPTCKIFAQEVGLLRWKEFSLLLKKNGD